MDVKRSTHDGLITINNLGITTQSALRKPQSADFEPRNDVGDCAVTCRKTRLKWVNDWKPTS
jgi:hypothetical protein